MLCSQNITEKRSIAFCVFLPDVTQEVISYEYKNHHYFLRGF